MYDFQYLDEISDSEEYWNILFIVDDKNSTLRRFQFEDRWTAVVKEELNRVSADT